MAWTYTCNPETVPIDEVRLLIGDTNPSEPFLQDEEIQYALNKRNGDALRAAIDSIEFLIAKAASGVDYKVGPEEVKLSQRLPAFKYTKKQLEERAEGTKSYPINTGAQGSGIFSVGMMDNI